MDAISEWGRLGVSNGVWCEAWVAPIEAFALISGVDACSKSRAADALNAAGGVLLSTLGGYLGDRLSPTGGGRGFVLLDSPEFGLATMTMWMLEVDKAQPWPGRRQWLERWAQERVGSWAPLLSSQAAEGWAHSSFSGMRAWASFKEREALEAVARSAAGGGRRVKRM
jgi:hypothetical protein